MNSRYLASNEHVLKVVPLYHGGMLVTRGVLKGRRIKASRPKQRNAVSGNAVFGWQTIAACHT